MPELDLDADQRDRLIEVLLNAFDDRELDRVLRHLDRRLDHLAGRGPRRDQFEDVIDVAEREGWTAELVEAARLARPGRREIQVFASELGAAPANLSSIFERTLDEDRGLRDAGELIAGVLAAEHRLCRIDLSTIPQGTGFLVGPDVVLTNYHVVEPAIVSGLSGRLIQCVFGYKTARNGRAVDAGVTVTADPNKWLVACSPPSPLDEQRYDVTATPGVDMLDFALLRLSSPRGSEGRPDMDEPIGWFTLTDNVPPLRERGWLAIFQHANGRQLQWDDGPIIRVNDMATRVHYSINTEHGSSGSPAFDEHFNLVALHHSGAAAPQGASPDQYNEGIPTATIFAALPEDVRAELQA